jgi:hypothetical protein
MGTSIRHRSRRRTAIVTVVAAAGILLAACGGKPPRGGEPVPPQPVTYFVSDQTGSRAADTYDVATMRAAEAVVDRTLRRQGHLVVVLVGGSEGESRVVHETDLVPRGPNRVFRQRDALRQRAETVAAIRAALTRTRHGTDLFGTLHAVGTRIAAGQDRPCELFVMSDFLQTVGWNLTKMPLTPEASRRLVRDLQVRGLVPDLRGCAVFGAGLGASLDRVPTQRSAELAAFWRRYFEAANGQVRALGPYLSLDAEGDPR